MVGALTCSGKGLVHTHLPSAAMVLLNQVPDQAQKTFWLPVGIAPSKREPLDWRLSDHHAVTEATTRQANIFVSIRLRADADRSCFVAWSSIIKAAVPCARAGTRFWLSVVLTSRYFSSRADASDEAHCAAGCRVLGSRGEGDASPPGVADTQHCE